MADTGRGRCAPIHSFKRAYYLTKKRPSQPRKVKDSRRESMHRCAVTLLKTQSLSERKIQ